jgi:hypothetical protein
MLQLMTLLLLLLLLLVLVLILLAVGSELHKVRCQYISSKRVPLLCVCWLSKIVS